MSENAKITHLHAVRDPKDTQKWCLVTSDKRDSVTINARVIAEGLNKENADFFAATLDLLMACEAFAEEATPSMSRALVSVPASTGELIRAAIAKARGGAA